MIKLKDLITEDWLTHKGKTMWFPAHTKPTMDMISMRDHIALYPTQMEKMFGKQPISSFHLTSPDHLRQLGKIIGKKKSISTSTVCASNYCRRKGGLPRLLLSSFRSITVYLPPAAEKLH